jgi:hypothetical protein
MTCFDFFFLPLPLILFFPTFSSPAHCSVIKVYVHHHFPFSPPFLLFHAFFPSRLGVSFFPLPPGSPSGGTKKMRDENPPTKSIFGVLSSTTSTRFREEESFRSLSHRDESSENKHGRENIAES